MDEFIAYVADLAILVEAQDQEEVEHKTNDNIRRANRFRLVLKRTES